MAPILNRLLAVGNLLFHVGPFDSASEAGRAKERQRRALLSSGAAVLAKMTSVAVNFLMVPLTLGYLGSERFGLWMAISSVIAMLTFADLGIGNGLLNAVSEAYGKNDRASIRRYISSAFVILSVIAVVILLVFGAVYPWIPWPRFFNVHSDLAARESGQAVAAFVICFALNIPMALVQRVQLGLQMGFVANLWQALGSLIALCAVVAATRLHAGLPILVSAMAGAPVFAALLNSVYFFGVSHRELRPRLATAGRAAASRIGRSGLLFVLLQLVASVTYASNAFIIVRMLGPEAATTFAVPDRMFSVVPLFMSMLLMPLWPAYGEAVARGDRAWAERTLKQSVYFSLAIAAVLSVALTLGHKFIFQVWLKHQLEVPVDFLWGMCLWKILEAVGNAIAMYLNGVNVVKAQLVIASVTAVTSLILKIVLVQQIGVSGVIWGTLICYAVFALLPYFFILRTARS